MLVKTIYPHAKMAYTLDLIANPLALIAYTHVLTTQTEYKTTYSHI